MATIGAIRSIAFDLAVVRHAWSGEYRDRYIVSNDADGRGLAGNYLGSWLETARKFHGYFDAIRGSIRHSPECYPTDPVLYVSCRFSEILWSICNLAGTPSLSGANFLVSIASYACVGGLDATCTIGEDNTFGSTLWQWRSHHRRFHAVLPESEDTVVYTSPRRGARAMETGHTVDSQWRNPDTMFGLLDETVRTRGDDRARGPGCANRDEFVSACERELQRMYDALGDEFALSTKGQAFLKALDTHLAVTMHEPTGMLRISDPNRMVRTLTARYLDFMREQKILALALPAFLIHP